MNEQQNNAELLIKHFLKNVLQIPSRQELDALNQRIYLLEREVSKRSTKRAPVKKLETSKPKGKLSNLDLVLETIPPDPASANIKTIKKASGLEDKQIRNCLFRLEKLGQIKRVRRGFYTRN
ncbi:MAG: hypothetical protein R6V41_14095 [Desulfobacteraceae bacterium]